MNNTPTGPEGDPPSRTSPEVPADPPTDQTIYDAIVVGLGVMGLFTCRVLANRGLQVLGLEQYDMLHDRGSSVSSTRIYRASYFEHTAYGTLMKHSLPGWEELEEESRRTLIRRCGVLTLDRENSDLYRIAHRSLSDAGLPFETLSAEGVEERFPSITVPRGLGLKGVFEPGGGYIYASEAMDALVESTRRAGAVLTDCCHFVSWRETDGNVEVRTDEQVFRGRKLVLTKGAWIKDILDSLGIGMTLVRKLVFWYLAEKPSLVRPDAIPITIASNGKGVYYFVPDNGDTAEEGVKFSRYDDDAALRERALVSSVEEAHLESRIERQEEYERPFMDEFVRSFLGKAMVTENDDLVPTDMVVSLFAYSPDGHFLIDRVPGSDNVILAGGFSGHGFKFAPLIGEHLARMALGEPSDLIPDFFRLDRFD